APDPGRTALLPGGRPDPGLLRGGRWRARGRGRPGGSRAGQVSPPGEWDPSGSTHWHRRTDPHRPSRPVGQPPMLEDLAAAMSWAASAGRRNPAATSASIAVVHWSTNRTWVGYNTASFAVLNGMVVPSRPQMNAAVEFEPPLPRPDSAATGACTA